MGVDTIMVDHEGSTAVVMLNRPEALNAMNAHLNRELTAAMDELQSHSNVRVIIITGVGDKAFCAGRDLKEYSGSTATPIEVWAGRSGRGGINAVAAATKPVIAAINGYAIGGGLELALACDIRIASDTATFGLYEIRRGFFPGGGATWRLPPLVGKGWAMEMILSGEPIDAATAERIGLVNRVVPHKELKKTTLALAQKIAAHSPAAVLLAKQAVLQAMAAQEASGANIGAALRALAETNPDRVQATRAFVDRKQTE